MLCLMFLLDQKIICASDIKIHFKVFYRDIKETFKNRM